MRRDAMITTDFDRFAFLGFSIRPKDAPHIQEHKPDTEILTVDSMLCPLFPMFDGDFPLEMIDGIPKLLRNIQSSYEFIESVYRNLDPVTRSEFRIYGYAIELDKLFKYTYDHYVFKSNIPKHKYSIYKFAYAVRKIIPQIGEFRGFDVVDGNIEWTSGLTNCGIPWYKAEECGELNRYHLFSEYADAKRFRSVADMLVDAHAPFAVWAIFEVPI